MPQQMYHEETREGYTRGERLYPRHWGAHNKYTGNASSPVLAPFIRHEFPSCLPVNRLKRAYYCVSGAFMSTRAPTTNF